jgi:molecular chaperone DnaK (HSP70)/transposase-like protein
MQLQSLGQQRGQRFSAIYHALVVRVVALCLLVAFASLATRGRAATTQAALSGELAAFGIDLGSENVRFAASQAIAGIQVLTNEQSKRETPALIAFVPVSDARIERRFGEAGTSPAYGRWPEYAVRSVRRLFERGNCSAGTDRVVTLHDQRVQPHRTCHVQLGGRQDLAFTDTELASMLFRYVQRRAYAAIRATGVSSREQSTTTPAPEDVLGTDAVLTVPIWFRQSQRAALVHAAQLANWNVRGLVSTPLAGAIRFALDREVEQPQTVLFVDIGAQGTTAALIRFTPANGSAFRSQTGGGLAPIQEVEVLGYRWHPEAGGAALDECLVEDVLSRLRAQSLLAPSMDNDERFRLRLSREVHRVREILSANQEALLTVELPTGEEHHLLVTRAAFQHACRNVFERIAAPVQQVLADHRVGTDQQPLHALIPLGGGSRTPAIAEEIQRLVPGHLWRKTVNAEEAAVMGAAFYAAALSPFFRVRPLVLSDVYPRPCKVCVANASTKGPPYDRCVIVTPRMNSNTNHILQVRMPVTRFDTELYWFEAGNAANFWDDAALVSHWNLENMSLGQDNYPAELELAFEIDPLTAPVLKRAELYVLQMPHAHASASNTMHRKDEEASTAPPQQPSNAGTEQQPQQRVRGRGSGTGAAAAPRGSASTVPTGEAETEPSPSVVPRGQRHSLRATMLYSVWTFPETSAKASRIRLEALDALDREREQSAYLRNALEAMTLRLHEELALGAPSGTLSKLPARLCLEPERSLILERLHQVELRIHQESSAALAVNDLEQLLWSLENATKPVYARMERYQKTLEILQQLEQWIRQHQKDALQLRKGRGVQRKPPDMQELLARVTHLAEQLQAQPSAELVDAAEQQARLFSEHFATALLSLNQTQAETFTAPLGSQTETGQTAEPPSSATQTVAPEHGMDHTEL